MTEKETKAVITFNVIDAHGEKTTCNIIEPLGITLERIRDRLYDLMQKYEFTGNITLQFVVDDNTGYSIKPQGRPYPMEDREFDESIIY